MTFERRFLKNVGWQYVAAAFAAASAFGQTFVIGRALGAESFGLMSANGSYCLIVFQLCELRLHETVIRYATKFLGNDDTPRLRALSNTSLALDFVSGTIALFACLTLAPLLRSAGLISSSIGGEILFATAIQVFGMNVSSATSQGFLRVTGRFKNAALVIIATSSTRFLGSIAGLHALEWSLVQLLTFLSAVALASNATLLILARKALPAGTASTSALKLFRGEWTPMLKFVFSTYLVSLTTIPQRDLDVTVLARTASLSNVGSYRVAKSFMTAIWAACDPIVLAVYPEIARKWSNDDPQTLSTFLKRLTRWLAGGSIVILTSSWLLVPEIVERLMGASYLPSISYFYLMSWGALLWIPLLWVSPLMLAAGRAVTTLKASLIASIVSIGLLALVVPRFGSAGAASISAVNTVVVVTAGLALGWLDGPLKTLFSPSSRLQNRNAVK